ncbi:MAG: aromatic hydrocarbon degradation protein, partial [Epsilonproteobacteria bacterium]
TSGFSIGITPLLQYGSLDIDYVMPSEMQGAMYYQQTGTPPTPGMFHPEGIGHGSQQDLKFGYNVGLAYEIDGLTLGAIYKSQIDMKYDGVLQKTMSPMSAVPYTNDKLSTPEEIGLGVSYNLGNHTVAIDYKRINWSDAKGYEDFEWRDQNVFIIGYQYATDKWALRAGFNYAKSPIEEKSLTYMNSAGLSGGVVNTMNLLGFPAITESHYTLGGSYVFSEKVSVDLAMMYAPEQEETYMNFVGQAIHTSHSQTSASLALNYKF